MMIAAALLIAQTLVCGTSPEMHERAMRLSAAALRPHSAAAVATRIANDTFYVRADDETVPNDDPADLEGLSLYFTRRDANTFAVTREPLRYDENVGPQYVAFDRATATKALTLPFAFPFGDARHQSVTLSVVRGIHFTDRPSLPAKNFDALEMLTTEAPLISPLLDYQGSQGSRPVVFVKQTNDAVTITFRRDLSSFIDFDMQAVLFANGDIRFSYKRVRNIAWGGVVVTTGAAAWMKDTETLATIEDTAGEVEPMLDIREVTISRVAESSLLELRIRTAAPIDRTQLPAGSSYLVFLGDSLNRAELFVFADRLEYRVNSVVSSGARIEGTDVVMYVAEEQFILPSREIKVWAYTNGDSATATIDLGPVPPSIETDFSAIASLETARPLIETYRLGSVNVAGVWQRLQREFGYREGEIDAVAIYTNFLSDIILTRYGAFATLANPGADGVSQYSSSRQPKTATLMHMNSIWAAPTIESATQILLHELGHRWLYYFDIEENGQNVRAVNPLGYHPAQWVATPGAFLDDSSPMGGSRFADNRNGTFTTPRSSSFNALTWHELYLMGLARAEEMQPWFYLRGTNLGDEYFAPYDTTVTGTRVDVSAQQLIAAMGPRNPSFETSPKTFRVLFVVLEREGEPAASLGTLPRDFERAFANATGGRGQVVTAAASGTRHRSVRK